RGRVPRWVVVHDVCRHFLIPELVHRTRDLWHFGAQPFQEPVAVEGQPDRVGQAVYAGHVAVTLAWSREDDQVAGGRPAGEQDLAAGVRDRFFDLPRRQEDDDVGALAAQAARVPGRQPDRPPP